MKNLMNTIGALLLTTTSAFAANVCVPTSDGVTAMLLDSNRQIIATFNESEDIRHDLALCREYNRNLGYDDNAYGLSCRMSSDRVTAIMYSSFNSNVMIGFNDFSSISDDMQTCNYYRLNLVNDFNTVGLGCIPSSDGVTAMMVDTNFQALGGINFSADINEDIDECRRSIGAIE